MSKDLKEVGEEPCVFLREEYSRQREQAVQRPCGGTKLGVLENWQRGWRRVSEVESGRVQRDELREVQARGRL